MVLNKGERGSERGGGDIEEGTGEVGFKKKEGGRWHCLLF